MMALGQNPAKLVQWKAEWSKTQGVKVGDVVTIRIQADIDPGWYIYGTGYKPDCGPIPFTLEVKEKQGIELVGGLTSPGAVKKYDDIFECEYTYFKKHGTFEQKVKITTADAKISGKGEFQICSNETGMCVMGSNSFTLTMKAETASKTSVPEDTPKEPTKNPKKVEPKTGKEDTPKTGSQGTTEPTKGKVENTQPQPLTPSGNNCCQDSLILQKLDELATCTQNIEQTTQAMGSGRACDLERKAGFEDIAVERHSKDEKQGESFWDLIVFGFGAFLAGLGALLTPCVFPMIPMTVSFFTSSSKNKGEAITKAIFYGLSIIAIYLIIGVLVSKLNGPTFATWLSTAWQPNVFFFIIFVVFAISFFGAFEITLPSSWVNKSDSQADKGGLFGVFFMAFTLVLVSFSCTGPIASTILIQSFGGSWLMPIVGMLGYSLAFALPFTIFAIFPSMLNKLPQSGGWLNSVKVVLGFIELALAFKFLSVADQVYHWGILDREIFLAIWIAIFAMMGIYLLGKIRLSHDSPTETLSIGRMLLSIVTFSFVIYMVPGMFGAPLKGLSGLLPPMASQDFSIPRLIREANGEENQICSDPMYGDQLHLPHSLNGYFDVREAICCAIEQGKPIFLDFTGHGCVNCRRMEDNVWSDPRILKRLEKDFVILAMYGDEKKINIPMDERYIDHNNEEVITLGDQASDFMVTKFEEYGQPSYFLLGVDTDKSTDGNIVLKELTKPHKGYNSDIKEFDDFLKKGIAGYKKMAVSQ